MNVNTGELRRLADQQEIIKAMKAGFVMVPDELRKEADQELGSARGVFVDMDKPTPLTKWAQQTRAYRKRCAKRKARKKIAKASRRRNRF